MGHRGSLACSSLEHDVVDFAVFVFVTLLAVAVADCFCNDGKATRAIWPGLAAILCVLIGSAALVVAFRPEVLL